MTPFADTNIPRRRLGRTPVEVGILGFGGATIGGIGAPVTEAQAQATLDTAWDAGLRYFDTAPWYGRGVSELRVGRLLREKPVEEFVISTKVGRILRAYEDSLQRLGLARIQLAIVHDLDLGYHAPQARWDAMMAQLITGGWRALAEMRSAGVIGGIGVGINSRGLIPRFLELFDLDFFLLAGRYTLMEQETLTDELPACVERGVGIVIGAVFGSGLLATGAVPGARYDYREPTPAQIEQVTRIKTICDRYGVPLAAAALQFPLAHPAVASVIPGPASPAQVQSNVQAVRHPIPADLWRDLKAAGLVREDAPTPAAR